MPAVCQLGRPASSMFGPDIAESGATGSGLAHREHGLRTQNESGTQCHGNRGREGSGERRTKEPLTHAKLAARFRPVQPPMFLRAASRAAWSTARRPFPFSYTTVSRTLSTGPLSILTEEEEMIKDAGAWRPVSLVSARAGLGYMHESHV